VRPLWTACAGRQLQRALHFGNSLCAASVACPCSTLLELLALHFDNSVCAASVACLCSTLIEFQLALHFDNSLCAASVACPCSTLIEFVLHLDNCSCAAPVGCLFTMPDLTCIKFRQPSNLQPSSFRRRSDGRRCLIHSICLHDSVFATSLSALCFRRQESCTTYPHVPLHTTSPQTCAVLLSLLALLRLSPFLMDDSVILFRRFRYRSPHGLSAVVVDDLQVRRCVFAHRTSSTTN
jgi:hypothetical protein